MTATGDRDNFNGDFTFTAPTGGVVKGEIKQVGSGLIVVARESAAATATYLAAVQGRVTVNKDAATGITFAVGAKVYADVSKDEVTDVTTGNVHIGYALTAATATDTTVDMLLVQPV